MSDTPETLATVTAKLSKQLDEQVHRGSLPSGGPETAILLAALRSLLETHSDYVSEDGTERHSKVTVKRLRREFIEERERFEAMLSAALAPSSVPEEAPAATKGIGLPRGESAARDEICDALAEAITWLGELGDAANESTTLDIRRDRHVGEDDGSMTVRGLLRLLTQNERDEQHRTDLDELMERTWQRVGRALRPTATISPVERETPTGETTVCRTKAEFGAALSAWNAAGRPGGRRGRPVLDTLSTCPQCGKTRTSEPELLPAFSFDETVWCTCPPPVTAEIPQ